MVGVPGRSKGCQTCRDRRIKCDLAKPNCMRCVKSKRKCSGYRREATFVYFDADDEKPSATYKPPAKNPPVAAAANVDKITKAVGRGESSKQVELILRQAPKNDVQYRDQFLGLFLKAYLPKDNDKGLDYGLSWTQHLPGSLHMSDALSAALTAVSTVMVGRSFGDENLVAVSHQLYGTALKNLRKALQNKKSAGTPDTLGATMALSNYELISPSGPNNIAGWVAHVQGAAQILQNRDYSTDQSPMERALMVHVKTNCIFDAMSRRHSTFIADPQWRQKLLSDDVPDSLRNVMVDLPALLEQTDNICIGFQNTRFVDLQECFKLLMKCQAVDFKLEQWHTRAWHEQQGELYWPEIKIKTEEDEMKGHEFFEENLLFSNLPTAQMMTSYWSTRSLLYDTMEKILRVIQDYQIEPYNNMPGHSPRERAIPTTSFSIQHQDLAAPISIDSCMFNAMKYADMVCRSVHFCTNTDHRHMGIQAMTQPLWLAQQIFKERDAVKSTWCLQSSKTLAARGLGMMERVATDFGFADYADQTKPRMTGG